MGLFSTKKKAVPYTAIQRMLDDASFTPSNKIGVIKYFAEQGGDTSVSLSNKSLTDYFIEAGQSSLPKRYERAYRYADSGAYAYGLPVSSELTIEGVDVQAVVKDAVEADLGHPVTMVYGFIGDANYQHFTWVKLIEQHGYNPTTNELESLTTSVGFPCYLQKAELNFGLATVQNDTTGESLEQYGFSSESGACLTRSQNLAALPTTPQVDTDVQDMYVTVTYQYIEIIPDTTAPVAPTINNLSTTVVDGYAEKNSMVAISVNSVATTTVTADPDGFFTYTFGTALTTADVVEVTAEDAAVNVSPTTSAVVPYTNGTPATVGTDETITHFTRTVSFDMDLLDYIRSAIPIEPAEADDTPITIPGSDDYVPEYDYIQACYTYVVSGITHIEYLTYGYGSGTNPALEDLFGNTEASGEFYPRLYFRLNQQNLHDTLDPTSAEHRTSKQMGRILGMDWKNVTKTLHDSIEEVGDVRQLFVTLAAPMNTEDPVIREYQYKYWDRMYSELTVDITTGLLAGSNARVGKTFEVADAAYTHYISFNAVSKNTITGTFGDVGSYTSGYVNAFQAYIDATHAPASGKSIYVNGGYGNISAYHYYRYQTTSSEYIEIRVYNAKSIHAFEGTGTTAVGLDENLIIPLDRTAVTTLTNMEKEVLFSKCFYLFVNLIKIIKIKWYQRGAFKFVMVVVAIVITVVSVGAGAPLSAYLLAIVTTVAVGALINLIVMFLIKKGIITGKLAMIVAVVAVIAGLFRGQINTQLLTLTGPQLLTAASFAFDMAGKAFAYETQQIYKEMDNLRVEHAEKEKLLKQAKAMLDTKVVDMDLELLLASGRSQVFSILGESPDDFMSKTPLNVTQNYMSFVSDYVYTAMQPTPLSQLINKPAGDPDEYL